MAFGKRWSRDELLVAINLYRKLAFGQLHARNPVITEVAKKLGRPPGSLAMKLCNLASLDPVLRARGIRGLSGASSLDREIWDEFQTHTEEVASESEEVIRRLFAAQELDEVDVLPTTGVRVKPTREATPPSGPTEKVAQVNARRGQQFFRQMVLNAFDGRCCVTGISVRELLVASHILPWGQFPGERLNPQNGLCLSRLHDAAFDQGFISFDADYRLLLSRQLRSHLPQEALEVNFVAYAGKPADLPTESPPPSGDFLGYHRRRVFLG
jgi:putative restriction endonuclease